MLVCGAGGWRRVWLGRAWRLVLAVSAVCLWGWRKRVRGRTLLAASTMARAAISRSTTSEWPIQDAVYSGVQPSCDARPARGSSASRSAASARLHPGGGWDRATRGQADPRQTVAQGLAPWREQMRLRLGPYSSPVKLMGGEGAVSVISAGQSLSESHIKPRRDTALPGRDVLVFRVCSVWERG
jgi:hypothetical protein